MQIHLESAKRIGRKIGLDEKRGYTVAIFLALIIVSATFIGYYVWLRPPPESYNTIYLLDSNNKAVDYPELLIANQNSTFSVYVNVENHMRDTTDYQIRVKTVERITSFPIAAQPNQIINMGSISNNGKPVEKTVSITQNLLGNYSVVFELWQTGKNGSLTFTQDYCVLKIQVTN
jgi:uncharacterized membrane protein